MRERGLGLVAAADWFDSELMSQLSYRDEHTKQSHVCGSGGANVPALNALLKPFGLGFLPRVYSGVYQLGSRTVDQRSGSAIGKHRPGSTLHALTLHALTPSRRATLTP